MSIRIDEKLVAHVARLSRLSLTEAELAEMHGHFEKVLRYVQILVSVDTTDVDPSVFALETSNVQAEDIPRESLSVDAALANAPSSRDGFFVVPRIIAEADDAGLAVGKS